MTVSCPQSTNLDTQRARPNWLNEKLASPSRSLRPSMKKRYPEIERTKRCMMSQLAWVLPVPLTKAKRISLPFGFRENLSLYLGPRVWLLSLVRTKTNKENKTLTWDNVIGCTKFVQTTFSLVCIVTLPRGTLVSPSLDPCTRKVDGWAQ